MNRALLVGINAYPTSPLNGCLNDVSDMAKFLNNKCGFAMDDIRLLTDSRATKQGIVERIGWLLTGLRSGDRVLFHYSGHGVQLPTRSPQGEVDGLDEAICPYDFDWEDTHTIRDKEFNKMFSAIPAGVEFVWVSDSCHSGDLERDIPKPYVIEKTINPPLDINWRLQTAKIKKIQSIGFNKIAQSLNLALISGCKSDQTSADAVFNNRYNGALTYFLLAELSKADGLTIPLTKVVKDVNALLKEGGYEQEPQLEGNNTIKNKPFLKP
jgi:metacaspase-1